MPSGWPRRARSAMSRKRPWSTTPGTAFSAAASEAASAPSRDRAVEDVVALVGDVGIGPRRPRSSASGSSDAQPPARVRPPEPHHLHGQPEALAEPVHLLRRLRHHHEAPRRRDHDLLAEQRAAAALDQAERGVHLVRAVQRHVELERAVELHDLDARGLRHLTCPLRGHDRPGAGGQQLRHAPHRPAGPQPDRHPGRDQLHSGRCCGLAGGGGVSHGGQLRTCGGRANHLYTYLL